MRPRSLQSKTQTCRARRRAYTRRRSPHSHANEHGRPRARAAISSELHSIWIAEGAANNAPFFIHAPGAFKRHDASTRCDASSFCVLHRGDYAVCWRITFFYLHGFLGDWSGLLVGFPNYMNLWYDLSRCVGTCSNVMDELLFQGSNDSVSRLRCE